MRQSTYDEADDALRITINNIEVNYKIIKEGIDNIVVKDEKVITIEALNMEIPLVSPQGGIIVSILS